MICDSNDQNDRMIRTILINVIGGGAKTYIIATQQNEYIVTTQDRSKND